MEMYLTEEEVAVITKMREKKQYEHFVKVLSLEILRVAYDYGEWLLHHQDPMFPAFVSDYGYKQHDDPIDLHIFHSEVLELQLQALGAARELRREPR